MHFVEDQQQKIETDTCGIFQLYLFIEKLLNEIFATEKNENESRIEAFIDENKIRMEE